MRKGKTGDGKGAWFHGVAPNGNGGVLAVVEMEDGTLGWASSFTFDETPNARVDRWALDTIADTLELLVGAQALQVAGESREAIGARIVQARDLVLDLRRGVQRAG